MARSGGEEYAADYHHGHAAEYYCGGLELKRPCVGTPVLCGGVETVVCDKPVEADGQWRDYDEQQQALAYESGEELTAGGAGGDAYGELFGALLGAEPECAENAEEDGEQEEAHADIHVAHLGIVVVVQIFADSIEE